ncbi:hypothetical protein SteCoe_18561 [Stentor coeruleus]|uniref:Kelch motif family protein n=1 Tax=Stentor coeruleus TaxID=5963 RepID=A0A1R2BWB2_9CILI|nr:hypothetical protein SteCoe_18561 [Stentor coeruleus]
MQSNNETNFLNQPTNDHIPISQRASEPILLAPSLLVSLNSSVIRFSRDFKKTEEIQIRNLTKGMKCLVLNNDEILIAGGVNKSAFKYNVSQRLFSNLPDLLTPRRFFGFSFIGDCPAVIGGMIDGKRVGNVEILINSEWIQIESLRIPRLHTSAIRHGNNTYVFGGISVKINAEIEKYEAGAGWINLRVKIPDRIVKFGLAYSEDSIFLLGGKSKKRRFRNKKQKIKEKNRKIQVYRFNVYSQTFTALRLLAYPFRTENAGSAVYCDGIIYLLNKSYRGVINYIPNILI